ncbi:MAG: CoA ester lyase [Alphaproteobacteria bacterium]|nr:CoA ester lyase [Alphaproteobacteria bacterium]
MAIRPRRSVLYMPGSNPRALEKARSLPADALILDLEDAVAPDAKEVARAQVADAVAAKGFGKREVIVRVNAPSTPWGEADFAAAAAARPDAILVPKVSTLQELHRAEYLMGESDIDLWAMIETPLAILNLASLAAAGGRLACFVMGTNDLVKELRGEHVKDRANLGPALSLSVLAARANDLGVIDGVFNDIEDAAGLEAHCRQAKAFGFDGKTVIHPSQVATANAVFAPSAQEVEAARKVIAAFALPENKNKGAIKLDGRMVELLHAEMARRTVAMADAIEALA